MITAVGGKFVAKGIIGGTSAVNLSHLSDNQVQFSLAFCSVLVSANYREIYQSLWSLDASLCPPASC